MSDTPTNALAKFIDRLVPPAEVEVKDERGNVYRVRSSISARKNIAVTRTLQSILGMEAFARVVAQLGRIGDGADPGEMIVHVAALTADDAVVEALGQAFEAAHPEALAGARAKLGSQGGAADIFPVEELLGALAPLFVGLVRRSVQALGAASGAVANA